MNNESDITTIDKISEFELEHICNYGYDKILKQLLDKFEFPKELLNDLLIRTASYGHLNCINHLIKKGADVTWQNNQAIISAGLNNSTLTVTVLINHGANISAQNNTIIKDAVFYGKKDLFDLCCDYGSDLPNIKNDLLELIQINPVEFNEENKKLIKEHILKYFR